MRMTFDAYAAPTIVLIFNTVFSVMFIIYYFLSCCVLNILRNEEEVRDDFCFFFALRVELVKTWGVCTFDIIILQQSFRWHRHQQHRMWYRSNKCRKGQKSNSNSIPATRISKSNEKRTKLETRTFPRTYTTSPSYSVNYTC